MVKVISLSNEAYGRLKALKGERSFSEVVIEEIVEKKSRKDIMEFFGVLKRTEEWNKIKNKILEDRKKFKTRTYKLWLTV